MLKLLNGSTPKQIKHMAISTLVILGRDKCVKSVIAQNGGIEMFIELLKEGEEHVTQVTRACALRGLWNEVYDDAHKKIMWDLGILGEIGKYLKDTTHMLLSGQGYCFFVLSHLAYKYGEQVASENVVKLAVDAIRKTVQGSCSHEAEQLLEGAFRMLSTVPLAEDNVMAVLNVVFEVLPMQPEHQVHVHTHTHTRTLTLPVNSAGVGNTVGAHQRAIKHRWHRLHGFVLPVLTRL